MKPAFYITLNLALLAGVLTTPAKATSTKIFEPLEQTVNIFNVTGGGRADLEMGLFDELDTGFAGPWLDLNLNGDIARFNPTVGQSVDYTVTNNAGGAFTLTDSDRFILALRDPLGPDSFPWTGIDYTSCDDSTASCTASWSTGVTELLVDVRESPVPLPAAAWLFASSLLGLSLLARPRWRAARPMPLAA